MWGGAWGMGQQKWGQNKGAWGGQQQKPGWQAQKRPASPAAPAGAPPKQAKIDKVVVSSKNPGERTKLATILGDYTVFGNNHNQTVFKKTSPVPGRPGVYAYLYYWDARDGQAMSGWWFGDQVGGNEVWAHNLLPKAPAANSTPPSSGWKTPWDGPVNPNLVVVASGTPPPPNTPAAKAPQPAAAAKGGQKAPAAPSAQETADNKKLEEALKKGNEHVKKVETAVSTCETIAKPLSAANADLSKLDDTVKKTEAQVKTALEVVQTAQKELATLRGESMKYHPEVKKKAITQFTEVQKKITAAQMKLAPLKNAGAELTKRKAFQKTLEEVEEKVKTAGEEVEKIETAATGLGSDPSEEDFKKVQELFQPANVAIMNANKQIDLGMKSAPATSKETLTKKKEETKKLDARIKAVREKIKEPLDKASADKALSTLEEKMTAVEDAYQMMEDAELPFMTGIEDLPEGQHEEAVSACEKAATALQTATNAARNFIQGELKKAEAYVASLKTSCKDSLTEAKSKNEERSQKLANFKKSTDERKVKGHVRDILVKIVDAEAALKKAQGEAGPLKIENLDSIDKESVEKAVAAVTSLLAEGEKATSEAQKGANQKKNVAQRSPALSQELSKVSKRLGDAQTGLANLKKDAQSATKVLKGKESAQELEDKASAAEATILGLEAKVPAEGKALKDSETEALIEALTGAGNEVNEVSKKINVQQHHLKVGPPAIQTKFKEIADKLQGRVKTMREKVEAVKKSTRELREKLVCGRACKKAGEIVKDGEAALEAVTAAEDPFLRGIEVIPLKDAVPAVEACEEAEKKVVAVTAEARMFVQKSSGELNSFDKETAKDALEAVATVKKSMESMNQKLAASKKDMGDRKKVIAIQKVEEKVEAAEAELEKAKKCAAPLTETESDSGCEEFETLRKSVHQKVEECRSALNQPRRETQGSTLRTDMIKALTDKLGAVQKGMGEVKESVKVPIEKWMSKKALKDADEVEKKAESALKAAKEASAVLVDQKGDSIYAHTVLRVVLDAIREHMKKTESTAEALFKDASGGKAKASKASFEKFLKSLPGLCEWFKELAIPEAALLSVIPLLGSDANDFQGLFHPKYAITQKVDMTEGEETKDAKVIKELAAGDIMQALDDCKTFEGGISRIKCKAVKGGEIGWVTRGSGRQWNTKIYNSSESSLKEVQNAFYGKKSEVEQCANNLRSKIQQAIQKKEGPLFDSKEELEKKKAAVDVSVKAMIELAQAVNQAKQELAKRQETLMTEAKQAKSTVEAAKVLGGAIQKAKDAEAKAVAIEELAKPMSGNLTPEDLEKVTDPSGTCEAVEKALTAAKEAVEEAKKELKEAEGKVEKDGPIHAVKAEKGRLESNMQRALQKASSGFNQCRRACANLGKLKVAAVETAICAAAHKKGGSGDDYFSAVAGKGKDLITEAAFSKYLSTLKELDLSADHKKLVFKDMLSDGALAKQRFLRIVQQYYVCTKDIGITTEFEISAKTVRKMNIGEIMELLEEPKTHEESGIVRVKGRALLDGKIGWVSMKGNAGTAFLEKSKKPYLCCYGDAVLYKGDAIKEEEGKKLQSQEILEVLEGPIPEKGGDLTRIQAKAKLDGKVGWFTLKDPTGAVYAEKDAKYKCVSTIALTDDLDVMKSKVLRKIETGELISKIEGPVSSSGASRIKGKADKDGAEGWITIKGNAGTKYVEETPSKVYIIKKGVKMQQKLDSGSQIVKDLKVDDVVEALGEPKTEKIEGMTRIKCKAFSDGQVGWVLRMTGGSISNWGPQYRCQETTKIYQKATVTEDMVVRKLDKNETLEFLHGPQFDDEAGAWAQFRADRDKTVGWVLIQDAKGKRFLKAQ